MPTHLNDDKEETLNNNDDEYDYDELLSTLNTHKMAAASASPVSQQLQAMLAHEEEEQIFVALSVTNTTSA